MSALSYTSTAGLDDAGALVDRLRAKFGPLAIVVAIHALFFYAFYSGLIGKVARVALPASVYVTFVAPPAPPKPAPQAAPKTVNLAPPPAIVPPLPLVQIATPEPTITPPQPSASVERTPAPAAPVMVASATPAPPSVGPKTITSGVEYIQAPQPVYPSQSRRMGEQGKVVLRILVNEKGLPDQVVVQSSSGSARLDEAGRQAALRALFKPHIEDGRAVAVFVIVPLNFQLAS